jgi:hypothetical protein
MPTGQLIPILNRHAVVAANAPLAVVAPLAAAAECPLDNANALSDDVEDANFAKLINILYFLI